MFKPVPALSLLAPTTALAQGVSSSADLPADAKDGRWPVGVAIAVRDSPYLGEVTRPICRGDAYSPLLPSLAMRPDTQNAPFGALGGVAERVEFEPTDGLTLRQFSRPVPWRARPSLRIGPDTRSIGNCRMQHANCPRPEVCDSARDTAKKEGPPAPTAPKGRFATNCVPNASQFVHCQMPAKRPRPSCPMNVLKLARLRPLMSLETVASAFGEHWVPPGEDGHLTCTPASVSARLDAEGRLGYIAFLRTFPGHGVIDGLHIGMTLADARNVRPTLQPADRDDDELEGWSRHCDITDDGFRLKVGVHEEVVRSIELSQPPACLSRPAASSLRSLPDSRV